MSFHLLKDNAKCKTCIYYSRSLTSVICKCKDNPLKECRSPFSNFKLDNTKGDQTDECVYENFYRYYDHDSSVSYRRKNL